MSRVLHQGDATGQGGAALVRMASQGDAMSAVQALLGYRLQGCIHPLVVRFADSAEIKAKKQAKHISAVIAGPPPFQQPRQQQQPPQHAGGGAQHQQQPHQMLLPPQSGSPRLNPYGSLSAAATAAAAMAQQPYQPQGMHSPFGPPQGAGTAGYYGPMKGPPSLSPASYLGHYQPDPPSAYYMAAPGSDPYAFQRSALMAPGANTALVSGGSSGGLPSAFPPPGGMPTATFASWGGGVASLYIKNLPADADRLFLYEKFAPFGAILSVKVGSGRRRVLTLVREVHGEGGGALGLGAAPLWLGAAPCMYRLPSFD